MAKRVAGPREFVFKGDPESVRVVESIQRGADTQAILERTLGRALLMKMQGKEAFLPAIYDDLGGDDPVVQEILVSSNDSFQELTVDAGIEAVRKSARSGAVAEKGGSKKIDIRALGENPMAQLPGQALNTLAAFYDPGEK